ncbi:MAG: hypothetical protein OXC40_02735, partial [Proteobacteria bacterium]|nr:hypothetical protein [Pseudomonadota bacterium]
SPAVGLCLPHLIFTSSVTGSTNSVLDHLGITVNKNAVPGDPRPPKYTSGVRFGTPALSTRGFQPEDLRRIAEIVCAVMDTMKPDGSSQNHDDWQDLKAEVATLSARYPLYPEW